MEGPLSERLDMRLSRLRFIKDNGRCRIYRAREGCDAVIVKQYRSRDAALARGEAEALRLYSEICEDVPEAVPVRPRAFNAHTSTLCMELVDGTPMSQLVDRARTDRALQSSLAHAMAVAGVLLRRMYETTRTSGAAPSDFLLEYLEYVSEGLSSVPLLGRTLFDGYAREVPVLWRELLRAGEPTSTVHGDPALNNILVRDGRVALIDFANTNRSAHLLADAYTLSVSLRVKRMPAELRRRLFDALHEGTADTCFPDAVHRFYWELQRRRWLFLKLVGGGAIERAEGLRSLSSLGVRLPLREAG
ncbi:MAG: phosphotransferase [Polyangiales bacterium]